MQHFVNQNYCSNSSLDSQYKLLQYQLEFAIDVRLPDYLSERHRLKFLGGQNAAIPLGFRFCQVRQKCLWQSYQDFQVDIFVIIRL